MTDNICIYCGLQWNSDRPPEGYIGPCCAPEDFSKYGIGDYWSSPEGRAEVAARYQRQGIPQPSAWDPNADWESELSPAGK